MIKLENNIYIYIYIYIYLIVLGSSKLGSVSSSLIWRKICMVFIMDPKRVILL